MFDPYHRWLAIPKDQRPPTYYQLLGISPAETEAEVIQEAALRQASHVRTYQTGRYAQQCQALLNEIGQAKVTLLNPAKRKDYDARLGTTGPGKEDPPGAGAFVFDFPASAPVPAPESPGIETRPATEEPAWVATSPAVSWLRPPPLLLAYAGLLLLGALLAFWLSYTTKP